MSTLRYFLAPFFGFFFSCFGLSPRMMTVCAHSSLSAIVNIRRIRSRNPRFVDDIEHLYHTNSDTLSLFQVRYNVIGNNTNR